jgi:hypothetical protein
MGFNVGGEGLLLQAQVVGVEVGLILLFGKLVHSLASAMSARTKQPGIFTLEGEESTQLAIMTGFVRVAPLSWLMPVLVPSVHSSRLIADNHFPAECHRPWVRHEEVAVI